MRTIHSFGWRSFLAHRTRTISSALAVTLGVTMTIASDVTGRAVTRFGEGMETHQSTAGILGAQLELWMGVVGWVILGVAAFLVFNAFAMSITQRRRQIGMLRLLGMTRRQVVRIVLVEALLTGGVGTALGLLAGPLVGRGVIVLLGAFAGIAHSRSIPSLANMLLAALLGIGITCLSVLVPARRATRISPLEALQQGAAVLRQSQHRRLPVWVGIAIIAMLAAYLGIAPPATSIPAAQASRVSWHGILTGLCALLWLAALALIVPALIQKLGQWARPPLSRLWGAMGRLAADNLQRDRGRVTLTVLTLAISIMMIVAITGALALLSRSMLAYYTSKQIPPRWGIFAGGLSGDLASWQVVSELDLSAFGFSDELYGEVVDGFGTRADILQVRAAIVPELDVVPGSMSFFMNPERMRRMALFDFYEGDWEHAMPLLEQGCGALITPGLARRHGIWLYETLTVPGTDGPVSCTVAGLGLSANFGASLIGETATGRFDVPAQPFAVFVQPHAGTDVDAFASDLQALVEDHPDVYAMDLRDADTFMETMVDSMLSMLNGPLLLAIAAAALGVVNTTAMSVVERRHELGLLRAAGATRSQVRAVVIGEAALMGLTGGLMGLVAGAGLAAIQVLAGDHSVWGLHEAPGALLTHVVRASTINGLAGTVIAPFICAAAAWLPARSALRGPPVEMLQAKR
jgi:putative ABC transport system permease protein